MGTSQSSNLGTGPTITAEDFEGRDGGDQGDKRPSTEEDTAEQQTEKPETNNEQEKGNQRSRQPSEMQRKNEELKASLMQIMADLEHSRRTIEESCTYQAQDKLVPGGSGTVFKPGMSSTPMKESEGLMDQSQSSLASLPFQPALNYASDFAKHYSLGVDLYKTNRPNRSEKRAEKLYKKTKVIYPDGRVEVGLMWAGKLHEQIKEKKHEIEQLKEGDLAYIITVQKSVPSKRKTYPGRQQSLWRRNKVGKLIQVQAVKDGVYRRYVVDRGRQNNNDGSKDHFTGPRELCIMSYMSLFKVDQA